MKFKIYMIDDNTEKLKLLPDFIKWLNRTFPNHSFEEGFINPFADTKDPKCIKNALEDPFGVILLDIQMAGTVYTNVATSLTEDSNCVTPEATKRFINDYGFKASSQRLAAVVALLAKEKHCRAIWCTRAGGQLSNEAQNSIGKIFDRLNWPGPREDESTVSNLFSKNEEIVKKLLQAYHNNKFINEGICFMIVPPNGDVFWDHSKLSAGSSHNDTLKKWLDVANCPTSSAKGLLCPNRGSQWSVVPTRNGYSITSKALIATCLKLGMTVRCITDEIKLPIQPGLPFLLSLAGLLETMNEDNEFLPPIDVEFSRLNNGYRLQIMLSGVDKCGKPVEIERLKSYYLAPPVGGKHETSERLKNLTLGKTELAVSLTTEKKPLFDGVPENDTIVKADFDQNGENPYIHLDW